MKFSIYTSPDCFIHRFREKGSKINIHPMPLLIFRNDNYLCEPPHVISSAMLRSTQFKSLLVANGSPYDFYTNNSIFIKLE